MGTIITLEELFNLLAQQQTMIRQQRDEAERDIEAKGEYVAPAAT